MGLSFLVSESVEALEVTVCWGDYHLVQEGAGTQNGHGSAGDQVAGAGAKTRAGGVRSWWQRTPREETVRMVLPATDDHGFRWEFRIERVQVPLRFDAIVVGPVRMTASRGTVEKDRVRIPIDRDTRFEILVGSGRE